MNLLIILSVLICLTVVVQGDECFNYIKILAEKDKCLSSRRSLKVDKAKTVNTPEYFFTLLALSKCNGAAFACGLTTSYVTEIFQGLKNQYEEYKNDDPSNGDKAGYQLLIGDDLLEFFKSKKDSNVSIAYNVRHIGPEDHVWTIEQLANGGGYRIYQSYFQAYSLKAWLSDKVDGLYTSDNNGDIMVFEGLKVQVSDIIKSLTSNAFDLSNYENAPSTLIPNNFKPFIKFVKDYNQTTAIANFKKAWDIYGKGKLLSWNEMENYFEILARITKYFNDNQNTDEPFDEEMYNQWTNLFGSPNPVHFPDLPNNQITNILFTPQRTYRFEVKAINFKHINCENNFHYISI